MSAPVVALLQPNTDALIAGPSSTDDQGQRWLWVRLGVGGKDGFVRADLVSAPRAGAYTIPSAAVTAPTGPSDLNAYAAYLQNKFGSYGNHTFDLVGVNIAAVPTGHAVTFKVSLTEALYLFKSAKKSDLQAWATALMADLKAHWPNQYVAGSLSYIYETFTPGLTTSDCHYVDFNNPSLDTGFFVEDYFVHAYYVPPMNGNSSGSDSLNVCYAS